MKKKIIAALSILLTLTVSSCKKFLQEHSQNLAYVQTAADLDELLVGEGYTPRNSFVVGSYTSFAFSANDLFPLHVMDDDSEELAIGTQDFASTPMSVLAGFHYWKQDPFRTKDESDIVDASWQSIYRRISVVNIIISAIPDLLAKGEPADVLKRINGEAHFLRAQYYFMLTNFYGKPYSIATAQTDLAVPLKTDPKVEDGFFKRNTVAEVYDQIIKDLKQAESDLEGVTQKILYRTNQAGAQALLSRVYLYKEDYENTITYADKVINKGYGLSNLNAFDVKTSFTSTQSSESIFSMGSFSSGFLTADDGKELIPGYFETGAAGYKASDNLMEQYSSTDLRRSAFFNISAIKKVYLPRKQRGNVTTQGQVQQGYVSDTYLIRLPEVYLNKAEAEAILGHSSAAATVQQLRINRFKPADLSPVNVTGSDLVNFIRDERRRELCFESHRWFDLRRYAVNSRYPLTKSIRHISHSFSNRQYFVSGYYELKPYGEDQAAYIVPISKQVIEFNQGALTNEIRPNRPINN